MCFAKVFWRSLFPFIPYLISSFLLSVKVSNKISSKYFYYSVITSYFAYDSLKYFSSSFFKSLNFFSWVWISYLKVSRFFFKVAFSVKIISNFVLSLLYKSCAKSNSFYFALRSALNFWISIFSFSAYFYSQPSFKSFRI